MIDIFPSSAAFDLIRDFLESSDAERKEAIRKAQAVFGFTLKNKAGEEDNWFIDLKDTGRVFKETPKKTDGTATLQEAKSHVSRALTLVLGSYSFFD